jgi:outer membrane receptor protein involved in Fe transport
VDKHPLRPLLWSFALAFAIAVVPLGVIAAPASTVSSSSISGTVKDAGGRAIGNATVSAQGPSRASTVTGKDGTFALPGLAPGTYLVTAKRTGYATVNTTVTLSGGVGRTADFTLGNVNQTTLRQIGRVVTSRNSATQLNTTPAATNTLAEQTYIERGQPQVSNVLEELPGVELQRFSSGGGPGANTVAALRGGDPAETQTLIDGHPVNGGPSGDYLLQFLNPLLLSDIEVSKGPGVTGNQIESQLNGSINFRTPSIMTNLSALATVGYYTYDGSTDSLRVSDTLGKFGFLVGYAQFGTPGYNTQPVLSVAANGTPGVGVIPDGTATTVIPATQFFENHSELAKFSYNFSNSTALTLGYLGLHSYADYTGNLTTLEPFHIVATCPTMNAAGNSGPGTGAGCSYGTNPTYTAPALLGLVGKTEYASSNADNLYLGNFETDNEPFFTADLRTTFGPGSFLARYYATSIARDISDPQEAYQPIQCDDPTCNFNVISRNGDLSGAYFQTQTDYLHGADLQYALPIGPNTYTASYDSHGDRTTACSGGQANPAGLGSCSVPSILQTSQTISVRGDLHFGHELGIQVANYFSHVEFVGSRSDPRIGITVQPNADVVLRASAGSSFIAPSAETAYNIIPHLRRTTLYEGPAIVPETGVSYDLGGDVRTGPDAKVALDVYVTRLFNRFNTVTIENADGKTPVGVFAGTPYSRLELTGNQATALDKGLELTYVKAPRYGFGTTDYLNFLRAFTGGSDTAFNAAGNPLVSAIGTIYGNVADGQQFSGYPFTHARAELNYTSRSGLKPAFGATYYGALNSFNEPGFVLFDAYVDARLKYGLHLNVSAQNIFNHDAYRTFGLYNYGIAPPALGGGTSGSTLYFAPPRQITLQLSRQLGNPYP